MVLVRYAAPPVGRRGALRTARRTPLLPVNRCVERRRHVRALTYLLVSFSLALLGYAYLGFDQGQTFAYAVAAYVMLNLLNYRAMFVRTGRSSDIQRGRRAN